MADAVLLIDDDVDVLRAGGAQLERAGYEVTRELSGEAGLSTWMALEEAADREGARWKIESDKLRDWTRPRWPLWLFSGLVIATFAWLGLVLGGFLAVPGWLRPFAEFWWTRLPFA